MSYDDRRRRPLYAPPPTRSRSTLATYGPLILTVTIATAGALAWIWADRRSTADDEDDRPPTYGRGEQGVPPPVDAQQGSLASRVNAAWARSPSPAQLLGSAGKAVSAGVAAVGSGVAAAGSSLGLTERSSGAPAEKGKRASRRDGREEGFSDHERWSEEPASPRKAGAGSAVSASTVKAAATTTGGKKKAVAVVVSAEHDFTPVAGDPHGVEHTSILSHLAPQFNPATTDLYVLIFSPSSNHAAEALNAQANRLLAHNPANVLPFATASGYVHMLRHLAPQLAYVVDTPHLAGQRGETIAQLKGWVGQTVVVVGDDGAGGLVDTETEAEDEGGRTEGKGAPWWEGSELVGLGKGVEVVDIRRVGDDWLHRVGGN